MSGQEPAPEWLGWHEPEVAGLTDEELAEYVAYWRERRAEFRRERRRAGTGHADARRWSFSAWKCSKRESIGIRETERRRIRRAE